MGNWFTDMYADMPLEKVTLERLWSKGCGVKPWCTLDERFELFVNVNRYGKLYIVANDCRSGTHRTFDYSNSGLRWAKLWLHNLIKLGGLEHAN